jgi:hypothetical protein
MLKTHSSHPASSHKCFFTALFSRCSRGAGINEPRPGNWRSSHAMKGAFLAMTDTRSNPCTQSRHDSSSPAAQSQRTAERELAAFHQAVLETYGPQEAIRAAQDWIEALERLDVPAAAAPSGWRRATRAAAQSLAFRVAADPVSR